MIVNYGENLNRKMKYEKIFSSAGNIFFFVSRNRLEFTPFLLNNRKDLCPGQTFPALGAGHLQTRLSALMGEFPAAFGTHALSTGAGAAAASLSGSAHTLA